MLTQNTNNGQSSTERCGADMQKAFGDYRVHPVAGLFPMMDLAALNELAKDIRENGLQCRITIYNGEIIDGRNRYKACQMANVTPEFIEWDGIGSVCRWILSVNLHRRHLTNQQRAMIAAEATQLLSKETRKFRVSRRRKVDMTSDGLDAGQHEVGRAAAIAGKLLNVSRDATNKAVRVKSRGDESLKLAVMDGRVSLDAAATVADLPKHEQIELVEQGPQAIKAAARTIRSKRAALKSNQLVQSADAADRATGDVSCADLPVEVAGGIVEVVGRLGDAGYEMLRGSRCFLAPEERRHFAQLEPVLQKMVVDAYMAGQDAFVTEYLSCSLDLARAGGQSVGNARRGTETSNDIEALLSQCITVLGRDVDSGALLEPRNFKLVQTLVASVGPTYERLKRLSDFASRDSLSESRQERRLGPTVEVSADQRPVTDEEIEVCFAEARAAGKARTKWKRENGKRPPREDVDAVLARR